MSDEVLGGMGVSLSNVMLITRPVVGIVDLKRRAAFFQHAIREDAPAPSAPTRLASADLSAFHVGRERGMAKAVIGVAIHLPQPP
jgi:hypothetical protein